MTITTPNGRRLIPEVFPAEGGGYGIGLEFTLAESGDDLTAPTKAAHTPGPRYTVEFMIE